MICEPLLCARTLGVPFQQRPRSLRGMQTLRKTERYDITQLPKTYMTNCCAH